MNEALLGEQDATERPDGTPGDKPMRPSADRPTPSDSEQPTGLVEPLREGPDKTETHEPHPSPERLVKLVLSLQPRDDGGYRAMVAVGTEGCDPLLRAVDVTDLPAALEQARRLATEAENQWQQRPRYPSARPNTFDTTTSPRRTGQGGNPEAPAPSTSDPSDQLSLFG